MTPYQRIAVVSLPDLATHAAATLTTPTPTHSPSTNPFP